MFSIRQKKNTTHDKFGFTLVETLVYLGLAVILLSGIVQAIVTLTAAYRNVKTARDIESSAIAVMDRIVRDTRDATSINTAQSTFNLNPGILYLNTYNASSTAITDKYYVANQRVMLSENGVLLGPLTSADVAVSSLIFRSYSTSTSNAVKIELTLTSASTSRVYITKNFYGTAVLRGSY